MRPDSQGEVAVPKPSLAAPSGGPNKRSAGAPTADAQAKRPRLDHVPARDKENKRSAKVKDEKSMMDDLMSGLDASMFDGIESSPVRSQKLSQRSPKRSQARLQVEYDVKPDLSRAAAPLQSRQANGSSRASIAASRATVKPKISAFRPVQREPVRDIKPDVRKLAPAVRHSPAESSIERSEKLDMKAEVKMEVASRVVRDPPSLPADDEEFAFDLDLGDLAHLDDDLLLKPDIRATVGPLCS